MQFLLYLCYNIAMDKSIFTIYRDVFCSWNRTHNPLSHLFYSSHIHDGYELLFFYEGDADYIIGGSIYHLQKNDMLLIQPSVFHNLRILSSRPYERIIFHFKESAVREDLLPFLKSAESFYQIPMDSPLKRIFDNLRDSEHLFSQEEFDYLSLTSLNCILNYLKYFNEPIPKEKMATNSNLEKILLYIDENPTLPLTIASLSEKFNLSPSWIAQSFKKTLGISPSQYINRKKITYAQSLINTGTSPVEAAGACSYINYTTFYRQYKKYLGVKPTQDKKY